VPEIFVDIAQARIETVSATDTDGSQIDTQGYLIPVLVPVDAAAEWLDLYDPASGTSPSAANSRIIARAVLEALRVTVNP
jgi:hypothetical protein